MKPPLTVAERNQWNSFLDYLQKRGYKGNAALDNRDTNLGKQLMDEYRQANPSFGLTYDRIPDIQQDLQNYRNQVVQQYRANKSAVAGVRNENEIMNGISPVDGWLGSKTSSWKYPGATLTASDGTVQNFGTNTSAYDAAVAKIRGSK